jgi:hypothetical protein
MDLAVPLFPLGVVGREDTGENPGANAGNPVLNLNAMALRIFQFDRGPSGAIQNSKHGGHNLALSFFQQLGANAVTE